MTRKVQTNANVVKDLIKRHTYITVPTNQRNYEWTSSEIQTFLNDLYQSFVLQEEFYIGMFILLAEAENVVSVWDGQQRLITLYLFIIALLQKHKDYTTNDEWYMLEYNSIAVPRGYMNEQEKHMSLTNNWTHLSKIRYIVEDTPSGTIVNDILNKRWHTCKDFVKHENKRYICNRCSQDFHVKGLVEKHVIHACTQISVCEHEILKKYHGIENDPLMNCMITIGDIVKDWELNAKQLKELYAYIVSNKLCCDIEICENIQTASRRFEQLNFRGKPVSLLTIAKNHFLSRTDDIDGKNTISKYFDDLTKRLDKITWIDVDEKYFFELAIRIYHKAFDISTNFIQLFNKCVTDTGFNFNELCIITELIAKIIHMVYPHRHLFPNKSLKCALQYIIIPLGYRFYSHTYILQMLDIVAAHTVRIKILKKRYPEYNFYKFSVPIYSVITQAYTNQRSGYMCLQSLRDILWKSVVEYKCASLPDFEKKIREVPEKFKNNKGILKIILYYYVLKSQSDILQYGGDLNVDCINELLPIKFRLGNCTLTEKPTKTRKPIISFAEKVSKEYTTSFLELNQNIASYFGRKQCFDMQCVDARERFITKFIYSTTERCLNPSS